MPNGDESCKDCEQERAKKTPPSSPECERLAAVAPTSQKIGEFLSWLADEKDVELFKDLPDECPEPVPFSYDTQALLAEFFGIDMKKVETEREALIEALRIKSNTKGEEHGKEKDETNKEESNEEDEKDSKINALPHREIWSNS